MAENPTTSNSWRPMAFAAGMVIVLAVWFGARVFMHYHFQIMEHAFTNVMHEMGVSLDEGHPIGEINVSRYIRNKNLGVDDIYDLKTQPGDTFCQFKTVDPGYGAVFAAARKIFFFMPDTAMRPVMLQLFLDALTVLLLYVTFYRWGWITAVFGSVLYGLHTVFAFSAATPWYHFWDGTTCTLGVLGLLWLYRLSKSATPRSLLIALAVAIGLVMGAGVWIRSSWFIFTPLLFGMCLFSKPMRPWIGVAFLSYAMLAVPMVMRATQLDGHLAYSTRMSWHTALQGLGRNPNPYGIEDNDLYLLTRTHDEQSVNYDMCDYSAQDRAIQEDYTNLWHRDPGFIVRSIAQRIFQSIFFNFDIEDVPFWNHVMLFLAWLGLVAGVWRRGDMRLLAVLSGVLYLVMNTAYSIVYYIHREYSHPTQMLLLFGAVVAMAGAEQLVRRAIAGWKSDDAQKEKISAANIVFVASAAVMLALLLPPVQKYLTPPRAISDHWDSPDGVGLFAYLDLRAGLGKLSPEQRDRFMEYVKSQVVQKPKEDPVFQFALAHLREITLTNTDGKTVAFWLNKDADTDVYEALSRAAKSISGVGYSAIAVFDPADPDSWNGRELRFTLLPNPWLSHGQVYELLHQKFAMWNWNLEYRADGQYFAFRKSSGCSVTRQQLQVFFNRQCEPHHVPAADQHED